MLAGARRRKSSDLLADEAEERNADPEDECASVHEGDRQPGHIEQVREVEQLEPLTPPNDRERAGPHDREYREKHGTGRARRR